MKFNYWLLCCTLFFCACQEDVHVDDAPKPHPIKKEISDVLNQASIISDQDSLINFIMDSSQIFNSPADKVILFRKTLEKTKPSWSPWVGKLYLHLGYWLNVQSKYHQALPCYEHALNYHEQTPLYKEPEVAAEQIYKVLANIYNRLGEKDKAEYLLEKALKIISAEKETLELKKMKARFCLDLSRVYSDPKAEDILHQGIQMFSEAEKQDSAVIFHLGLLYVGLADIQNGQDKIAEAEKSAKLGIKYLEDPYYHATALVVLGNVYFQKEKNEEAIPLLTQATNLVDPNTRERGKIFLALAQIYLVEKKYTLALHNCQRALKEVLPRLDTTSIYQNPLATQFYPENTIWEALMLKAKVFQQLYLSKRQAKDLQGAEDNYDLAQKIFILMRDNLNYEASKVIMAHQSQEMFQGMCELAYTLWKNKDKTKASEWIYSATENNKAVLLRQKLAADRALNHSNLSKEQRKKQDYFFVMQEKRAVLLNEVHDLTFAENPDPEELKLAKIRLDSLEDRFYALKNDLKNGVAFLQMEEILPLKELQKTLKNGTVVVSYAYFPELDSLHFFAFSLSKQGVLGLVKGDMPLETLDTFLTSVSKFEYADGLGPIAYEAKAKSLYQQLLTPILPAHKKPKCLVIVPDGRLAQLPFDILIDPKEKREGDTYAGLAYLLNNTYVSYQPAISIYNFPKPAVSKDKIQPYLAILPDYSGSRSLPTLDQSAYNNIEKISAQWNGKIYRAGQATKDALKNSSIQYLILHFFGHAKAVIEDNSFSWLAFSSPKPIVFSEPNRRLGTTMSGDSIHPADRGTLLYAHEIANLNLNAELVCLTGCETGLGQKIAGEGAISLAWAFQQAGCPSTAMSLWKLQDVNTSDLSTLFFDHLYRGCSKDEALTLAKRKYLKLKNESPYYWGGLVLMGDRNPISTRTAWYKWW